MVASMDAIGPLDALEGGDQLVTRAQGWPHIELKAKVKDIRR